jgi:hypothetical protein
LVFKYGWKCWKEINRMKYTVIVLALALTVSPAFAKPKEKTFPASCGRVWAAVKRATVPPHYNFAQLDDAQKRYLDITLSGTGDTCTVAIGGNYSGLVHNDKGDLFKRIEEALAETSSEESVRTSGTAATPASSEQHTQAERPKPAGEVGTITLTSMPDGAEVYVDGSFVGNAPATLRLTPGKHTIRVVSKGYKDWSRELSVLASSDVKLTANLDK